MSNWVELDTFFVLVIEACCFRPLFLQRQNSRVGVKTPLAANQTLNTFMFRKVFFAILLTIPFMTGCSDQDTDEPAVKNPSPKEQWGKTLMGNDGTIFAYPDLYVNYWEYTWRTHEQGNDHIALCIKGAFPSARFFSLSLYDDEKGEAIGGLADNEITPDEGSVNPFAESSSTPNFFTVYIVPSSATDEQIAQLSSRNVCKLKEGVNQATIIIREYLGVDEYGGVELPEIRAIDLNTMKEVAAPLRMNSNVKNFATNYTELWSDKNQDMPFFLASRGDYYPNNSTDYLFARTILPDNQVLTFSFMPVPIPKTVEDYKGAPARYWSMCFGSALDTHSYYSVYDTQVGVPDGQKCTFVVCMKQNAQLEAVRQKVAKEQALGKSVQLIVWDRERKSVEGKEIGNCIVTLYRNILPNKEWEHSISKMIPTPYGDPVNTAKADSTRMIAHEALGDYGPYGMKYPTERFLSDEISFP